MTVQDVGSGLHGPTLCEDCDIMDCKASPYSLLGSMPSTSLTELPLVSAGLLTHACLCSSS